MGGTQSLDRQLPNLNCGWWTVLSLQVCVLWRHGLSSRLIVYLKQHERCSGAFLGFESGGCSGCCCQLMHVQHGLLIDMTSSTPVITLLLLLDKCNQHSKLLSVFCSAIVWQQRGVLAPKAPLWIRHCLIINDAHLLALRSMPFLAYQYHLTCRTKCCSGSTEPGHDTRDPRNCE